MEELQLTDSHRAFINLMRTPYRDWGVRLCAIARAIDTADERERLDYVMLFLQLFQIDDRAESMVDEPKTFTDDDLRKAQEALALCVAQGMIDLEAPFRDGLPVRQAAAMVLEHLQLLRQHGTVAQALYLDHVNDLGYMPYADPETLPRPDTLKPEELVALFCKRPALYARMYKIVRQRCNDPMALGSCLRQLIADEPGFVQGFVLAWAISATPMMRQEEFRRLIRAGQTNAPGATDLAAINIDVRDKNKVN